MTLVFNGSSLEQVEEVIAFRESNVRYMPVSMRELATGFGGGYWMLGDDSYRMGKSAENVFWKELGFPMFPYEILSQSVREIVVDDRVKDIDPKKMVTIRTEGDGGFIEDIIDGEYKPISNVALVKTLRKSLPKDAVSHRWDTYRGRLDMRIISPSWTHNLGTPTSPDPAFGGIHVTNNGGNGSLQMSVVLARVACFNYHLARENVVSIRYAVNNNVDVMKEVGAGVEKANMIAGLLALEEQEWRKVPIGDVIAAFSRIREKLGLSERSMADALEWFEKEGGNHTLFHVAQAVARATQNVTDEERKNANPNNRWRTRNRMENDIVAIARHLAEHGEDSLLECPVCHSPISQDDIDD